MMVRTLTGSPVARIIAPLIKLPSIARFTRPGAPYVDVKFDEETKPLEEN
jgi:hypothetical protein